jgi:hypothetical protein
VELHGPPVPSARGDTRRELEIPGGSAGSVGGSALLGSGWQLLARSGRSVTGGAMRCVRREVGWRRGVGRDPRPTPARQSSTLPMSGV